MRIAGILLAAGGSTRLGFPKQLVRVDGQTLVRRAAQSLLDAGCYPVAVVVGAHAARIQPEVADLPVTIVNNAVWNTGMAESIRAGMAAVFQLEPATQAVLIALCDQPRVTAAHLRALLELFSGAGKPVAAAAYGQTLGVPAVFAREVFPELLALEGEAGARKVIAAHGHQIAALPMDAAALDVDTPADVAALGVNSGSGGELSETPG